MFARFLKDESGATAIEYGLIAALIAVAIITARRIPAALRPDWAKGLHVRPIPSC